MTNTITIDGRLTRDVEVRFTPSGKAVANFTVAHNTRRYNRDTQEWEDGDTTFIDVALWGKKGENLAESAGKGSVVAVAGALYQQTWEDKNGGGKRSKHIINAESVALVPMPQDDGQAQGGGQQQSQGGWGQQARQQQGQAWGNPPPTGQPAADEEPPF